MPRYFFHVRSVEPSTDTEGEELPDAEATWKRPRLSPRTF